MAGYRTIYNTFVVKIDGDDYKVDVELLRRSIVSRFKSVTVANVLLESRIALFAFLNTGIKEQVFSLEFRTSGETIIGLSFKNAGKNQIDLRDVCYCGNVAVDEYAPCCSLDCWAGRTTTVQLTN